MTLFRMVMLWLILSELILLRALLRHGPVTLPGTWNNGEWK